MWGVNGVDLRRVTRWGERREVRIVVRGAGVVPGRGGAVDGAKRVATRVVEGTSSGRVSGSSEGRVVVGESRPERAPLRAVEDSSRRVSRLGNGGASMVR